MNIMKADYHRKLELAGVPNLVSRPVDIDQAQTGFALLRSLRIYCFEAGSIINGHAEADEVLMIILAGSVQLTMSERDVEEGSPRFSLSAVGNTSGEPCAAYLAPNGAYRLVPLSSAEVAYARATTTAVRAPKVFAANMRTESACHSVLFEETTYPAHLRLRVAQLRATHDKCACMPVEESEFSCEAFVHVRTESAKGAMTITTAGTQPVALQSWDTIAVLPDEQPTLRVAEASSALLLIVLASK